MTKSYRVLLLSHKFVSRRETNLCVTVLNELITHLIEQDNLQLIQSNKGQEEREEAYDKQG